MQTLNERVQVVSPLKARNIDSRYSWLSLSLAEPNLGAPYGTGMFVLTSDSTGGRGWSPYSVPQDFLTNSITAVDLIAFRLRGGTGANFNTGIVNSYILGDGITAGYSNTTFVNNLSTVGKIYALKGGEALFDSLTARSFVTGYDNIKTGAADFSSYIIGNNITAGMPNFTYVNNLTSQDNIYSSKLFSKFGGDLVLDSIIVTSLTAVSAVTQITDTRIVVLQLTALSADDIYSAGNITSAKTVSGMRGQFYELSASRFFAGENTLFYPSAYNSYALGSNLAIKAPNTTFVENLCAVGDLVVEGTVTINSGDFNVNTITANELSAKQFIAGDSSYFTGAATGLAGNAFILGKDIVAGIPGVTYVNNLCATNSVYAVKTLQGNSVSANNAFFTGISSRGLIAGNNSFIVNNVTNSYILGSNIRGGFSNTTYTNNLSVIGNLVVVGNLSASTITQDETLTQITTFVKENSGTILRVDALVQSQSAYWMEPIRKFDYVYATLSTPEVSYSGVAPASASPSLAPLLPSWTITRITYSSVGTVSAVDKAYNAIWNNRTFTIYDRIWP